MDPRPNPTPRRRPFQAAPWTLFTTALLSVLLIAGAVAVPATAGGPDAPEVLDPAGDAGPNGNALPAGGDWADIVAAWFDDETPETVWLNIQVSSVETAPPYGELAVHLQAGERWFLVGWTTVLFPAPPFRYQGGFVCPATPDGRATSPSECYGIEGASVGGDVYRVPVPRAGLGLGAAGATISAPTAYAELYVDGDVVSRVDVTEPGRAYVFTTGTPAEAAPAPVEGPRSGATTSAEDTDQGSPALPSSAASRDDGARGTPGPGPVAGLAALVVAGLASRRGTRLTVARHG